MPSVGRAAKMVIGTKSNVAEGPDGEGSGTKAQSATLE